LSFLFKHKILLVAVAVILLVSILAIVAAVTGGYASPVSNAVGNLFKPLQTAMVSVSDQVASYYGYMYEYDALKEENEQLRVQIAEMQEVVRESESALEENARLRVLQGLTEKRRDFELESATITARNVSNWASVFTISRGSADGIKPHDCVINEENFLVGVVTEVGQNWATVATVVDTDMEAGAYNTRTGQTGVVEGNFDLMRQGLLRLSYLSIGDDVKNGDRILTTGIGGVFPRDIVIGDVTDLRADDTGISAYAIIKPAVDLNGLTQVFVIKSFNISE